MQVSNWVIFGAAEVFAVLVIVCVFLLFHTRSLKGLVTRLQDKIQSLVNDLKQAKADIIKAQAQSDPRGAYIAQLDKLIDQTRDFHSGLNPDRDIALDLSNDSPLPRQVAALRFAALVSEKEAVLSSDDSTPNWVTLEDKFTQLVNFFRSQAIPEEGDSEDTAALREQLENSLQRVENLEKFKALFFQMEDQWRDAKQKADSYYEQLSSMQVSGDQQASFDNLLTSYNDVYNQIGQSITQGITVGAGSAGSSASGGNGDHGATKTRTVTNTIEITKTDTRAQNELRQLRSVAEEQHRLINELQNRLRKASSPAEKDAVIKDLQDQLERQIRFVQESETCIQLLENEISQANAQLNAIEADKSALAEQLAQIPEMQTAIAEYTEESKEMLKTIDRLEQENRQLVTQVEMSGNTSSGSGADSEELNKLKQQYAELEARYLELRMQG